MNFSEKNKEEYVENLFKDIELDDDFIEDLTEAFLDKNITKEKKINFNISPINNLFEEKYYRKDELEKIGLITEKKYSQFNR